MRLFAQRHLPSTFRRSCLFLILAALGAAFCSATIVPRLSLNQMVTRSEIVVVGSVTRSWTAWDIAHQFIWTHTEIAVRETMKGNPADHVVVSEPGGELDGVGMRIVGSPSYTPGEQVILFLERMPNGFLRSAGFGQGKLTISHRGRILVNHGGADLTRTAGREQDTALQSLDGASASELRLRLARLVAPRKAAR